MSSKAHFIDQRPSPPFVFAEMHREVHIAQKDSIQQLHSNLDLPLSRLRTHKGAILATWCRKTQPIKTFLPELITKCKDDNLEAVAGRGVYIRAALKAGLRLETSFARPITQLAMKSTVVRKS